jgi:hypothetical protein
MVGDSGDVEAIERKKNAMWTHSKTDTDLRLVNEYDPLK